MWQIIIHSQLKSWNLFDLENNMKFWQEHLICYDKEISACLQVTYHLELDEHNNFLHNLWICWNLVSLQPMAFPSFCYWVDKGNLCVSQRENLYKVSKYIICHEACTKALNFRICSHSSFLPFLYMFFAHSLKRYCNKTEMLTLDHIGWWPFIWFLWNKWGTLLEFLNGSVKEMHSADSSFSFLLGRCWNYLYV